ncbi:hypothetical protein EHF33_12420 [Deinococcus psychrotolerans]|uniref:Uncharacterized protein n=1 Tax=Deinococcus psychrotolerans TaxID=2489213 RepID=A0A3G8YDL5_9DEIO|nr:hypothetical protein [Deinococcus psychrotolerans]AZI43448.1 hypothetical protein EHF33_12420 [Deinococcus psychrotolerans]
MSDKTISEKSKADPQKPETAGLPIWLFPLGFGVGLALLIVGVIWPAFARWAVYWLMLVPVIAALFVAVSNWRTDRRLSIAALLALLGVGLVLVARKWI